jgi:DNA invertase Pin-like site-specific DNA recombinase
MLIGYARVSTTDQNLSLQKDALEKSGCEKIFSDTTSGASVERAGLDSATENLRRGDVLVVWRLDRLGRSLKNLIAVVALLESRGIGLRSLQENIDTTTSGGKLVFHIFCSLAEFERSLIRERTKAGLEAARSRGRCGGRPRRMDNKKIAAARVMHAGGAATVAEICRALGVSRATFYRYVRPIPTPSPASQILPAPVDGRIDVLW